MKKNSNIPDSDESARPKHAHEEDDLEAAETTSGQTSNKSGKHSSVEKLAASRPEFGESPGAHPVAGADGDVIKKVHSEPHRDKALRPK